MKYFVIVISKLTRRKAYTFVIECSDDTLPMADLAQVLNLDEFDYEIYHNDSFVMTISD